MAGAVFGEVGGPQSTAPSYEVLKMRENRGVENSSREENRGVENSREENSQVENNREEKRIEE